MARRRPVYEFAPLPNQMTLATPHPVRFRRRSDVDTEGRGAAWQKGTLKGFDSEYPMITCALTMGSRVLQWSLWEMQQADRSKWVPLASREAWEDAD